MTSLDERLAYQLIYAGCEPEPSRFTNDLPVNADVWLAYAREGFARPIELLLTPHIDAGVGGLRSAIAGLSVMESRREAVLAGGGRDDEPAALQHHGEELFLAVNESHVLAKIHFFQLLKLVPLTAWWDTYITSAFPSVPSHELRDGRTRTSVPVARMNQRQFADALREQSLAISVCHAIENQIQSEQMLRRFKQVGLDASRAAVFETTDRRQHGAAEQIVNLAALYVGLLLILERQPLGGPLPDAIAHQCSEALHVLADAVQGQTIPERPSGRPRPPAPLWLVTANRDATHAIFESRKSVKADAAGRVFDTGGAGVRWAVIDSGIDARHPAFARLDLLKSTNQISDYMVPPSLSRVVKTLDFTRFAEITSGRVTDSLIQKYFGRIHEDDLRQKIADIANGLAAGQMLDWGKIELLLEIPHPDVLDDASYAIPNDSHGTHVAGIIGAKWTRDTYKLLKHRDGEMPLEPPTELADGHDICGVCPEIEFLDLRVFNPRQGRQVEDGADEFAILAALQYVRHLNQSKDRQVVHGVNLSLSLRHDVRSYGCGSTPVCLECDRLVGSGVVVVAAAGNYGYDDDYGTSHLGGAYRGQSITDPGNAASIITVGATHRKDPYQYGISYFSSHGPTGDGRLKPDLVAPGEKVLSTVPGPSVASKDGTSMAAPHVSGVAALLLSRNSELMGHPSRVKDILCNSASDLGRGREFQGYGLVDALRALQSV